MMNESVASFLGKSDLGGEVCFGDDGECPGMFEREARHCLDINDARNCDYGEM